MKKGQVDSNSWNMIGYILLALAIFLAVIMIYIKIHGGLLG